MRRNARRSVMTEFSTVSPAFVIGTQQPREPLGIGDELDANLLSNAVPDLQWQIGGGPANRFPDGVRLHQEHGIGRLH